MKNTTLMSAAILGIFAAGAMASTAQLTGNNLPAEEKEGCKGKDGCKGKEGCKGKDGCKGEKKEEKKEGTIL